MDEIMVKKLDFGNMDLNSVSKNDLVGYLQTRDTINRINDYLISPFEDNLKNIDVKSCDLFDSNGMYLGIQSNDVDVKSGSFEIVSRFEKIISNSLIQNKFNKRVDGVKRYNGTISFDALNLHNLVKHFKSETIGLEKVLEISTQCSDLDSVLDVYSPRLVFLESKFNSDVNNLTQNDVGFYIAGKSCVENLKSKIINPFEDIFLSNSDSYGKNIFKFDDLGVIVNNDISDECDYDICLSNLQNHLLNLSGLDFDSSDGKNLFFNNELLIPRMYVSQKHLSNFIKKEKSNKFEVLNRDLSVEYMPNFTHII